MNPSPFQAGYADGLHDRGDQAAEWPEGRQRDKYSDGHRIGVEDRVAGALEPAERVSP
jgi:ribosome modulation factor